MGQGEVSQSKCMRAGTWAMACSCGIEDPETTKAGKGVGPEAGGYDGWASVDWGAVICGCVAFWGNSEC